MPVWQPVVTLGSDWIAGSVSINFGSCSTLSRFNSALGKGVETSLCCDMVDFKGTTQLFGPDVFVRLLRSRPAQPSGKAKVGILDSTRRNLKTDFISLQPGSFCPVPIVYIRPQSK